MTSGSEEINALVTKVMIAARDFTPRDAVELGVIHGLCVDAARKGAPHLTEFLASVSGLVAITGVLSQLPHIVVANDPNGAVWTFVRVR
jgi:hypothetical protein